jgi:NADH:ubiquinone oxidoreductase subunit 6 (subunit J)
MIPTIGLMLGTYIIVRLVEIIDTNNPVLQILCLIALIVNICGMIFLWQNSTTPTRL